MDRFADGSQRRSATPDKTKNAARKKSSGIFY
jgi:hypothetical protein